MVIIGAVLLLVAVIVIVMMRASKHKAKRISAQYSEASGNAFHIKGDEDSFIISKNQQYDFLVEQGRIVASRDRSKSKKFVYYEGE